MDHFRRIIYKKQEAVATTATTWASILPLSPARALSPVEPVRYFVALTVLLASLACRTPPQPRPRRPPSSTFPTSCGCCPMAPCWRFPAASPGPCRRTFRPSWPPRRRCAWCASKAPAATCNPRWRSRPSIPRQRGLNTYVGRFCASACTLAFLGGRQCWVAPTAHLGFHQAHAPGVSPAEVSPLLRAAYEGFAVPAPFIDHILRRFPRPI